MSKGNLQLKFTLSGGPIYTQIEEAVDFVLRNIRLGATIDGLVRKEKYELPPEAIREMIINAHCHRNLLAESCIQVVVYDDRLEVKGIPDNGYGLFLSMLEYKLEERRKYLIKVDRYFASSKICRMCMTAQ